MKRNIQIIRIIPQGYCKGVVNAIKHIKNVLKENKYKRPYYMLGELVHNSHVTSALRDEGIITIDNYDNISNGSVIVTAHGLSKEDKDNIIKKGLELIDATCPEVFKIQELIYNKINEGYSIIYYGKTNHPESNAILKISSDIHLITSINEIVALNINNKKLFFTNQTTMSYFETLKIVEKLKNKYPNIEVDIDICNASKLRQTAVYNKASLCDIVLVVGDKKSNNTNKLKELCEEQNIKAYLIENIEDLSNIDIKDNMIIGITAGASTPTKLVFEVIKSLEDDEYVSTVTDKDYINF